VAQHDVCVHTYILVSGSLLFFRLSAHALLLYLELPSRMPQQSQWMLLLLLLRGVVTNCAVCIRRVLAIICTKWQSVRSKAPQGRLMPSCFVHAAGVFQPLCHCTAYQLVQ
jgi:hypothetical protein